MVSAALLFIGAAMVLRLNPRPIDAAPDSIDDAVKPPRSRLQQHHEAPIA
jgi:hypothetical protein